MTPQTPPQGTQNELARTDFALKLKLLGGWPVPENCRQPTTHSGLFGVKDVWIFGHRMFEGWWGSAHRA